MEMCVSKYIKSQILRQIKEEKGDEKLEFIFSHKGVESLIFDYRDKNNNKKIKKWLYFFRKFSN